MSKSTSAENRYKQACEEAMSKANFNHHRRREWLIWGSVHRPCPTCKMGKGLRCLNLVFLKKNEHVGVRWPHDARVDWPRIWEGLKKRGYIE